MKRIRPIQLLLIYPLIVVILAGIYSSVGAHGAGAAGERAASPRAHSATRAAGPRRADAEPRARAEQSGEGSTGPYHLIVTFDTPPVAGRAGLSRPMEVGLSLDLSRSGIPAKRLEIMHTKPMHLIAVSEDLSHFLHIHPEDLGNGKLRVNAIFPVGGKWILFADFKERDQTVIRVPITISEIAEHSSHASRVSHARALKPSSKIYRGGPGIATLSTDVWPLTVGERMLTFQITDTTRSPVTDLRPVLGAMGHLVVIREGANKVKDYIHAHPMDAMPAMPGMAASATMPIKPGEVMFHVEFPGPGRYKLWAEFSPNGEKLLATYVVDVKSARATSRSMPASTDSYSCPMHPDVRMTSAGSCPKCGMPLMPLMPSKRSHHEH